MLNLQQVHSSPESFNVDAYLYSRNYELSLSCELAAFNSVLDYAASNLTASQHNRILTKIEHNYLIKSQIALKLGNAFELDLDQSRLISVSFLIEAAKKALSLTGQKNNYSQTLSEHGFSAKHINASSKLREWHSSQNITELSGNNLPEAEHNLKALHYLCQLIVFTFTPKDPSDLPDSLIVSPDCFFNLSNIWASRPELYDNSLALSPSGKQILYKDNDYGAISFRTNLGRLADLHLQLADKFWRQAQPIDAWIKD